MSSRRSAAAIAALVSLSLLAAGACSGGAPDSASSSTAASGVDPNAPEVNPAGDIPDNQVFVTYTVPSGLFSLKVPEGWARTDDGTAVTFTDNLNSIRMETAPAPDAPTVESATADELPVIASAASAYEPGKVEQVDRTGGPAILVTYRADGAADPVTGRRTHQDVERYEFWDNGTETILTLAGPQGADNVDPWRIVTDSFAFAP